MINRVTGELNVDSGFKAFILHGKNLTDTFIHRDLTITNIDYVLRDYLFEKGFSKILFYQTKQTLKVVERMGSNKKKKKKSAPKKEKRRRRGGLDLRKKVSAGGSPPLSRPVLVPESQTEREPEEQQTQTSRRVDWVFAMDEINAVMLKRKEKSAIVFLDAHIMEFHGELSPEFFANFHDWIKNSINGSIILFLFVNENLRTSNVTPELQNMIEEDILQVCKIGGVGPEELARLIQRERLLRGLEVDWRIVSNTVDLLGRMSSARDCALDHWKSGTLLGGIDVLNKSTIKEWKQMKGTDSVLNFDSISDKRIENLDKENPTDLDIEEVKRELATVRDQEDSIEEIIAAIDLWYIRKEKKPLTILLSGASGTGKTFTYKKVAEALGQYGYQSHYLSMAEFKSDADLSRLIGSPPGYVGSETRPELFSRLIEADNKLVICFDEIDKAYEGIREGLMQLFDEGFLSWNNERGDYRNCIMFFTSNAAMDELVNLKERYRERNMDPSSGEFKKEVNEELDKVDFPSYILGRMDKVLVYNTLSPSAIIDITAQETQKTIEEIKEPLTIEKYDDEYLYKVLKESHGSTEGARIIGKTISFLLNQKNNLTSFMKNNKDVERSQILKSNGLFLLEEYRDEELDFDGQKERIIKRYREEKDQLGRIDRKKMASVLSSIRGQEDNIEEIVKSIRSWFQYPPKPLTIFLAGTSGTGKSYTAEKIGEAMSEYEYSYYFCPMNEYQDQYSASNIFGTPKGIAGSTDKPKLFKELDSARGKLVICFDEIEKAYDGFYNRIMSLMQNGTMDWAYGKGDFRECIIFMTSNVAMNRLVSLKKRYQGLDEKSKDDLQFTKEVNKALNDNQIPPFITRRMDLTLVYNSLGGKDLFHIAIQEIEKLAKEKRLRVRYISPLFLASIMKECEGSVEGASMVQKYIKAKIGEMLTDFVEENSHVQEIIIE